MKDINDEDFFNVIKSNKLIVIDFYSIHCAPCKLMEKTLLELEPLYKGSVEFYKVCVDKYNDSTLAAGVRSLPTVLLMKQEDELNRIMGTYPLPYVKQMIEKYR